MTKAGRKPARKRAGEARPPSSAGMSSPSGVTLKAAASPSATPAQPSRRRTSRAAASTQKNIAAASACADSHVCTITAGQSR